MCMGGLRMCVYVHHVCVRCLRRQKRMSSPEVEFWVVVSHHVVLVTKYQFSAGTASVSLAPN